MSAGTMYICEYGTYMCECVCGAYVCVCVFSLFVICVCMWEKGEERGGGGGRGRIRLGVRMYVPICKCVHVKSPASPVPLLNPPPPTFFSLGLPITSCRTPEERQTGVVTKSMCRCVDRAGVVTKSM